jgi:hypothetical protein
MNNSNDPTSINPLITEYLEKYDGDVREICLQAIDKLYRATLGYVVSGGAAPRTRL